MQRTVSSVSSFHGPLPLCVAGWCPSSSCAEPTLQVLYLLSCGLAGAGPAVHEGQIVGLIKDLRAHLLGAPIVSAAAASGSAAEAGGAGGRGGGKKGRSKRKKAQPQQRGDEEAGQEEEETEVEVSPGRGERRVQESTFCRLALRMLDVTLRRQLCTGRQHNAPPST